MHFPIHDTAFRILYWIFVAAHILRYKNLMLGNKNNSMVGESTE